MSKYWEVEIKPWMFLVLGLVVVAISGYMLATSLDVSPVVSESVDPERFSELMKQDNAILFDLNWEEWYNESHINGSINHPVVINKTCWGCWYKDLKSYCRTDQICLFYDKSGIRSKTAMDYCKKKGFPKEIYILQGGFVRWKSEGYPFEN